jgi:hypothetical protein
MEAMKKNWFPVACLLILMILTAGPLLGGDDSKSKPDQGSSSLDAWLCANVSPLFCPGIPDLRSYQPTPDRQPPQRVRKAQTSPKDLKERAR